MDDYDCYDPRLHGDGHEDDGLDVDTPTPDCLDFEIMDALDEEAD